MRQLTNTEEDKKYLKKLLKKDNVDAEVTIGVFTSNLASSIIGYTYKKCSIIKIYNDGYVEWITEDRILQPTVSINCVKIKQE